MAVTAYHGDSALKEKFVAEMKWHREQDMILQGAAGEGEGLEWKGCCIACGVHSMSRIEGKEYEAYNHKLWETLIGVPMWMAHLCESIFEGLTEEESKEFPIQFAESVQCGTGLDSLRPAFSIFVLESIRENARDDGKAAIDQVISLWRRIGSGEEVSEEEWSAARSAAESAERSAESAAWSAAESAERSAWSAAESAWSAAESAAWSAESAAWSAWSARPAAWSAAWSKFRDELLRLVSGGTK